MRCAFGERGIDFERACPMAAVARIQEQELCRSRVALSGRHDATTIFFKLKPFRAGLGRRFPRTTSQIGPGQSGSPET